LQTSWPASFWYLPMGHLRAGEAARGHRALRLALVQDPQEFEICFVFECTGRFSNFTHLEHVAVPSPLAMVPGTQTLQLLMLELPGTGFALPASQALHAEALDDPVSGL
jgi:hypothetical protein